MKNRFIAIDILRVIAICFIIMVRHIDDYASDKFQCPLVEDLTVISLGILVFVSGYLLSITNNIFNSISDIKIFIIRRILRIYPLYAFALLVFYFLSIINIQKLISGLLLYNLYVGEYILTLWFISMIMAFYLAFALLNYRYNLTKFLFISSFIFLSLILERIIFKIFDSALILYFPAFIFGILFQKYSNYLKLSVNRIIFLLSIFLILLFMSANNLVWNKLSIPVSGIMIIIITSVLIYYLDKKSINKSIMTCIKDLSFASFCMYLTHRAIFTISLSIYKPNSDILTLAYLYLVAIPIIFVLSFYMQRYYDKLVNAKVINIL